MVLHTQTKTSSTTQALCVCEWCTDTQLTFDKLCATGGRLWCLALGSEGVSFKDLLLTNCKEVCEQTLKETRRKQRQSSYSSLIRKFMH